MSDFTSEIKEKAIEIGFEKIGIARVESTNKAQSNLETWISKGRHASMEWIDKRKEERGNIYNYFPEAVSLISVGMNYYSGYSQKDLNSKFKFSNYAWGDDYHSVLKSRLKILLEWIRSKSADVKGVACVDTSPVMEKVADGGEDSGDRRFNAKFHNLQHYDGSLFQDLQKPSVLN